PTFIGFIPIPADTKPIIPIDKGTMAKNIAPSMNDFLISDFLVENALCQNDWSPKGPLIKPIDVDNPKAKKTSLPFRLNKLPYSPVIPLIPILTAFKPPPALILIGANTKHTSSIIIICNASVTTLAFIPENWL